MKYWFKYVKKQDLRNEIYISSKLVGNDNFFPDPEVIDPFPKGEDPHCVKIKVKWKGIDSDYVEYDLKKFRTEFHSNTDIRIAGTPSKKKLNSIISFTKNNDSSYYVEVIDTNDIRYKKFEKPISDNPFRILDELPKTMKNQILYGPPGTGKTYSTITKALDIIGIDYSNYNEAQELFQNELGKRIEFITMHQSFSYEDFVQGLKPVKEDNGIGFEYKSGVFKEICKRANLSNVQINGKLSKKKIDFETVYNYAFNILLEHDEEIEINRGNSPFKIYKHSDRTLWFRTANGTEHSRYTLAKKTLKIIFERKVNDIILSGNKGYWDATLKFLIDKEQSLLNLKQSEEDNSNHVIILDEINRANISRVFGELIALIEEDKRDGKLSVTLPSGDPFTVPSNLYIIGTMNTADKSIALVDIALRRRFKFIAMYPDLKALKIELKDNNFTQIEIDERVNLLSNLNQIIRAKKSVDFEIGHSYFMQKDNLIDIMNDQILPLLNEYFMYDLNTVKNILEKQQKDREGNQIPKLGIKIDEGEFKTRGLLRITSINPEQED